MKNVMKGFLSLLLLTVLTTSCQKENEEPIVEVPVAAITKAELYDKWWYPVEGQETADLYFHADGNFEQTYTYEQTNVTISSTGTWEWINDSDTISIETNNAGSWEQEFITIKANEIKFSLNGNASIFTYNE